MLFVRIFFLPQDVGNSSFWRALPRFGSIAHCAPRLNKFFLVDFSFFMRVTSCVAARDPHGGPPKRRCRLLQAVVERTRALTLNYVRVVLAALPGLRPGGSKQFVRQAVPTASKRQRCECLHIHLASWHGLQSTTTTGRLDGRNGAEMLCVIEVKWHETFGMVEYADLKVAEATS